MDDIISMGYRESVTIQEVIDQLKMESAEERAHIALLKQQEEDAKAANEKKNLQSGKWSRGLQIIWKSMYIFVWIKFTSFVLLNNVKMNILILKSDW